ncbi:MAG: S41 family peptidase [Oceanospirillaceae bacterium]|jgi:carboxyl-terminal processing protease|nr:S41 family peptidase [Oceanospirillaceae bacterium]MBT4443881.1 S41 family peptidase [Oceanospirillaceae bacterium]MBT6078424.1 S41 family peptidase [Oceanospirillaceae bacterium]MBT7330405.1 S41 family peptidase [Oceanospirillaceae bacterium]
MTSLTLTIHPLTRVRPIAAVLRCLSFGLLLISGTLMAQTPATSSVPLAAIQSFVAVYERIRLQYVEAKDDEQLLQLALQGLILKLDPYSSYLDAETMTTLQQDTKGEYSGIGVELVPEGNYIRVITPIDDSPAYKAGILPGDWITHVQGQAVKGLDNHALGQLMTGPTGSQVTLQILRKGKELRFELTRELIVTGSVRGELMQTNVGYIRISHFQDHTSTDLQHQMQTLLDAGAKHWLLDLRNNPGGTLNAAAAVADSFLTQGTIVTTQARQPQANLRFDATTNDPSQALPMVVLINNGSASASEIVAGAMKGHQRAQLVGNTSFGKGSVQSIIGLPNGAGIKLTTAYYFTPTGHNIHNKGIAPHVQVDDASDDNPANDAQLAKALMLLNKPTN